MIKNPTVLFAFCAIALGLTILATLYVFLLGNFHLFRMGVGLCLLFIVLLIVVHKECRIRRLMNEDDYDRDHDAI